MRKQERKEQTEKRNRNIRKEFRELYEVRKIRRDVVLETLSDKYKVSAVTIYAILHGLNNYKYNEGEVRENRTYQYASGRFAFGSLEDAEEAVEWLQDVDRLRGCSWRIYETENPEDLGCPYVCPIRFVLEFYKYTE
ncbi:MAG: hypothetical protein OXB93_01160 [Cytophagales bacterium]|nr:hypothetical protein [Cytophagales bacterium]